MATGPPRGPGPRISAGPRAWAAPRLARWRSSRPGRAFDRYSRTRGSILCGGIAYSALFSLFAALTIGYTAFTAVLGGHEDLLAAVLARIDSVVPGLIDTGSGGVLKPADLLLSHDVATGGVSAASVVATVVLVVSAMSFMSALRRSVRTMFAAYDVRENPVGAVLREVIGFLLIVVGVVVSTAATIVVSDVGRQLLELVGLSEVSTTVLAIAGVLASVVVDALVVALVVTSLAGMHPSRRDLALGSLVAGVAFFGTALRGEQLHRRKRPPQRPAGVVRDDRDDPPAGESRGPRPAAGVRVDGRPAREGSS